MICAIDPGHTNCAYVIMHPETREVVESGIRTVSRPHYSNDAEVAQNCVQLMIELCAKHNIERLCVEFQGLGRAMTVVESSFLAAAMCCGISRVETVNPLTLKAYYKGLGCRGNRQNKKDAEALIVEMGYPNFNNHVADCILIALYALDGPKI